MQRCKVIKEIFVTEQMFVKDIETAIRGYMGPLVSSLLLSRLEVPQIFGNLESVLFCHTELLRRLEQRIETCSNNELPALCLADVFLQTIPSVSFRLCYKKYCKNYSFSQSALRYFREQNSELNSFLEHCQQQCNNVDLGSFLIKPVQRICKYPLLLKELLKFTDPEHSDYEGLIHAVSAVEEVGVDIENTQEDSENLEKLLQIQRKLDGFQIVDRDRGLQRVFIREGLLFKQNPRGLYQERIFFLFSDVLIYCKKSGMLNGRCKFRGSIPLSCSVIKKIEHLSPTTSPNVAAPDPPICHMESAPDNLEERKCPPVVAHVFQVIRLDTKKAFTLGARTNAEKEEWLADIETVINEQLDIRFRTNKTQQLISLDAGPSLVSPYREVAELQSRNRELVEDHNNLQEIIINLEQLLAAERTARQDAEKQVADLEKQLQELRQSFFIPKKDKKSHGHGRPRQITSSLPVGRVEQLILQAEERRKEWEAKEKERQQILLKYKKRKQHTQNRTECGEIMRNEVVSKPEAGKDIDNAEHEIVTVTPTLQTVEEASGLPCNEKQQRIAPTVISVNPSWRGSSQKTCKSSESKRSIRPTAWQRTPPQVRQHSWQEAGALFGDAPIPKTDIGKGVSSAEVPPSPAQSTVPSAENRSRGQDVAYGPSAIKDIDQQLGNLVDLDPVAPLGEDESVGVIHIGNHNFVISRKYQAVEDELVKLRRHTKLLLTAPASEDKELRPLSTSPDDRNFEPNKELLTEASCVSLKDMIGGTITKEGLLQKKAQNTWNWNVRHFAVGLTHIAYAKPKPKDDISFKTISLFHSRVDYCPRQNKFYSFSIKTNHENVFYFSAKTEREMFAWVDSISNCIRHLPLSKRWRKGKNLDPLVKEKSPQGACSAENSTPSSSSTSSFSSRLQPSTRRDKLPGDGFLGERGKSSRKRHLGTLMKRTGSLYSITPSTENRKEEKEDKEKSKSGDKEKGFIKSSKSSKEGYVKCSISYLHYLKGVDRKSASFRLLAQAQRTCTESDLENQSLDPKRSEQPSKEQSSATTSPSTSSSDLLLIPHSPGIARVEKKQDGSIILRTKRAGTVDHNICYVTCYCVFERGYLWFYESIRDVEPVGGICISDQDTTIKVVRNIDEVNYEFYIRITQANVPYNCILSFHNEDHMVPWVMALHGTSSAPAHK